MSKVSITGDPISVDLAGDLVGTAARMMIAEGLDSGEWEHAYGCCSDLSVALRLGDRGLLERMSRAMSAAINQHLYDVISGTQRSPEGGKPEAGE